MDSKILAEEYSKRAFLNSFLRDYLTDLPHTWIKNTIKVKLKEGTLELKLAKNSLLGLHEFEVIKLNQNILAFSDLIDLISSNFSTSLDKNLFKKRVFLSLENMEFIFKTNQSHSMKNYLDSEKKLLLGHPFHPWPKCKEGMDAEDLLRYSPELEGTFKLSWVHIPDPLYIGNQSLDDYKKNIYKMLVFDGITEKSNHFAIPFHPWQWNEIQKRKYLGLGNSILVEEGKNSFDSLSSMRSYYNQGSPYLLKSSLNVRLTNSLRQLSQNEAERSQKIEKIIKALDIRERIKHIDFLMEPFYVSVKNHHQETIRDCVVQFRENFPNEVNLGQTFLLSSFVEIHPVRLYSSAHKMIEGLSSMLGNNLRLARKYWFDAFLEKVIAPFLNLATEEGILLGAHMQNLIIRFEENLPCGVIYRDFQGSGLTVEGFEKIKNRHLISSHEGLNILNENETNKVFGYYLVVNTVFNSISMLAESNKEVEFELLNDFRNFIFKRNADSPRSFYTYLLDSPSLYQKGNFRCCLSEINENTEIDPWKIYNQIPNPLRMLRKIERNHFGEVFRIKTKNGAFMSLRVIEESDLDLFHSWHQKDFVSKFWELNLAKEELLTYIRSLKKSPSVLPLIVELDSRPFAYFETYWAYDDRIAPYCNPGVFDRGIHLLIGEEKFLRTRHVYDAMLYVTQYLFESEPRTQSIWGEPRADNTKILQFCKKLPGWQALRQFDFPHKRAMLLECKRDNFYRELSNAI